MTPRTGLFISFEGIDGAGKSTHIEAVAQAFEDQGRAVTRTREPGGTPLAERLRELVLNAPMDALTESLLVFAARRDHMLWFDLPASVAAARLASARVPDKFEAQPQAFFEAVAAGYARRLAEQPQRFARVDANVAIDAVRTQVLAALRGKGCLA